MYHARNININKFKSGDKIPLEVFIGDETYHLNLRYLKKENIKTQHGRFRAIKFKMLLIKGNIFTESENIYVWMIDGLNQLIVRG